MRSWSCLASHDLVTKKYVSITPYQTMEHLPSMDDEKNNGFTYWYWIYTYSVTHVTRPQDTPLEINTVPKRSDTEPRGSKRSI